MIEKLMMRRQRLTAQLALVDELIEEINPGPQWTDSLALPLAESTTVRKEVPNKPPPENARKINGSSTQENGRQAREVIGRMTGNFGPKQATEWLAKQGLTVSSIHSLLKTMIKRGEVVKRGNFYMVGCPPLQFSADCGL